MLLRRLRSFSRKVLRLSRLSAGSHWLSTAAGNAMAGGIPGYVEDAHFGIKRRGPRPRRRTRFMVYRGALVVEGSGCALVVAIGDNTVLGRPQGFLGKVFPPEALVAKDMRRITRFLFVLPGIRVLSRRRRRAGSGRPLFPGTPHSREEQAETAGRMSSSLKRECHLLNPGLCYGGGAGDERNNAGVE
jgi:hypothetical protein